MIDRGLLCNTNSTEKGTTPKADTLQENITQTI
jgi:hypothetical protein